MGLLGGFSEVLPCSPAEGVGLLPRAPATGCPTPDLRPVSWGTEGLSLLLLFVFV